MAWNVMLSCPLGDVCTYTKKFIQHWPSDTHRSTLRMMDDTKITILFALIIGSEVVRGQEDNGIFDGEFAVVTMLIIIVFCLCGVYLCLYFTCWHDTTVEDNAGCCSDVRDKESNPNNKEDENVPADNSKIVAEYVAEYKEAQ